MIEEWVTIPATGTATDSWRINVTFMLSTWRCIWGEGCKGVAQTPDWDPVPDGSGSKGGCCAYGFTTTHAERRAIQDRIDRLTPEDWENHRVNEELAIERDWYTDEGDYLQSKLITRDNVVITDRSLDPSSVCVFYNREEGGCAFHKAALTRGQRPLDWKPEVCWMVPLSITEDDTETVITAMRNLDWGGGEFAPLDWWCIESPEAYATTDQTQPVYISLKEELTEIMGPDDYETLSTYLDQYMALHRLRPTTRRRFIPVRAE